MSFATEKIKLPFEIEKNETTKFLMNIGVYKNPSNPKAKPRRCIKFCQLYRDRHSEEPLAWKFQKSILLYDDEALAILKFMRDNLDYDDAIARLAEPVPEGAESD